MYAIRSYYGSGLDFSRQAHGAGFVGAKEVQGRAAQEGEVLGGIAQTDLAGILTKGDVKAPMQAVLNPPMSPHGMQDTATVGGKRRDHIAFLGFNPAGDLAGRFDAGDGGELRPGGFQIEQVEPVQLADGGATTRLKAAVPLVPCLVQRNLAAAIPRGVQDRSYNFV